MAQREHWTVGVDYAPDSYPFSPAALERFCRFISNDAARAKPSEIILRFNRLTAEAYLERQRLVTESLLDQLDIHA